MCVLLIVLINRTFDLLLVSINLEKQARQRQRLLAKELHHRIQNLFAVVQAVVRFSLPGNRIIEEPVIKQRLLDRLQSMAQTNRTIVDSMGEGVRLLELINGEIRGFESQVEIAGAPKLVLGPQMTQNLSLILHELLTNALKHGALSVPQGRVSLRLDWTASVLTFVWSERCGPSVAPPGSPGFGSRILGTFAKSFCDNVEASYPSTGFRYTLQIRGDQDRCVEQPLTMTPAPETSVRDAANINEIFLSDSLNGELEFEAQEDLVLDDRELRELLPERNKGRHRFLGNLAIK